MKKLIGACALERRPSGWEMFKGPLCFELLAVFDARKDDKVGETCWHVDDPDLSNLLKLAEDALVGILYEDDNIIAEEHLYKIRTWRGSPIQPHLSLVVTERVQPPDLNRLWETPPEKAQ
jgi:hypothetical protein